ncbi:DUF1206 domain-containing protein [Rufibacter aurantiacus]|uniref:DUF1206 domain-containing protein n=1 Tax=Rufibacter aurantiacus TaxID=2817374 RepID=UPI001B30831A|nr:DUF1206 domain-containing protein [Rufibacter aurantiacus]
MNQQRKHWIESFAKAGYIAKGFVYILVGALTAMAAFGIGGKKASSSDALTQVKDFPAGGLLLSILAVGLVGYSIWRFVQAIHDTEHKGSNAKGIGKRLAYAFSGLIYGSLAFAAFKILSSGGNNSGEGGSKEKDLVSGLLDQPFGKWLVIIIGLITIGNGIRQLIKGTTASFMKDVRGLPRDRFDVLKKAGQAGFTARGVVFSIIGFLFVRAAWLQNPQEAGGTQSAFSFLQTSPFGNVLLAVVALGLIGYGVFMFVQAKYSDISIN